MKKKQWVIKADLENHPNCIAVEVPPPAFDELLTMMGCTDGWSV